MKQKTFVALVGITLFGIGSILVATPPAQPPGGFTVKTDAQTFDAGLQAQVRANIGAVGVVQDGTNQAAIQLLTGTAVLSGSGAATITNSALTANSRPWATEVVLGTVTKPQAVGAFYRASGAFVLMSTTTSDTSTVVWFAIP